MRPGGYQRAGRSDIPQRPQIHDVAYAARCVDAAFAPRRRQDPLQPREIRPRRRADAVQAHDDDVGGPESGVLQQRWRAEKALSLEVQGQDAPGLGDQAAEVRQHRRQVRVERAHDEHRSGGRRARALVDRAGPPTAARTAGARGHAVGDGDERPRR